jgi:hypothetical protein
MAGKNLHFNSCCDSFTSTKRIRKKFTSRKILLDRFQKAFFWRWNRRHNVPTLLMTCSTKNFEIVLAFVTLDCDAILRFLRKNFFASRSIVTPSCGFYANFFASVTFDCDAILRFIRKAFYLIQCLTPAIVVMKQVRMLHTYLPTKILLVSSF